MNFTKQKYSNVKLFFFGEKRDFYFIIKSWFKGYDRELGRLKKEFLEEIEPIFVQLRKGDIEDSDAANVLTKYQDKCEVIKTKVEEEFDIDIQRIDYFQQWYVMLNRKLKYIG